MPPLDDKSSLLLIAVVLIILAIALDILTGDKAEAAQISGRNDRDTSEVNLASAVFTSDSIAFDEGNLLLYKIKPNPFTDSLAVRYSIAKKSDVKISVYNDKLELLERNVYRKQKPGRYDFAVDDCELPEGSYFLKIEACGKVIVERIVKMFYEPEF